MTTVDNAFEGDDTAEILRADAFESELVIESVDEWFWSEADTASYYASPEFVGAAVEA
jgi:hypothetical protein